MKDPSFDYYLDQQIEEHMKDEPNYPGDLYERDEEEEEEEEGEEDDENEASYSHPSLRKFNPLGIILEEEDV